MVALRQSKQTTSECSQDIVEVDAGQWPLWIHETHVSPMLLSDLPRARVAQMS